MLALDDAGQTLAMLPVIVRGTNTAATSQVDGNVQMQRAVTVMVGNVESLLTSIQSSHELVSKGYQEALGQNLMLTETLQSLVAAKSEQSAAAEERLSRSRRLDQMFEKFLPMLELGFGVVAAEVERRYSDKNKLPAAPPAPPPAAPPPPPPPPPPAPPPAPDGTKDLVLCVFSAPSIDDVRDLLSRTGNDHWEEIPFWVDLARRRHMLRAELCEQAVADIRAYLKLTPPVLLVPNHIESTSSSEVVDLAAFDAHRGGPPQRRTKPAPKPSVKARHAKKTPAPKHKR
jgi:hypothetical protein